jgi:hypothetical protein
MNSDPRADAPPAPAPASEPAGELPTGTIYGASRASLPERPAMWRWLRAEGWPINCSWIDESDEGSTNDFAELWLRITNEIRAASKVVLYAEAGDFPLKGAILEAGIALGMGKPVVVCLPGVTLEGRSTRPIGSWIAHPLVTRIDDIKEALAYEPRGGWTQLLPASAEPTGELPTGPGVWKREGDLWLAEFVLEKLESLIGASQIDMRRGILGEFVDQDKLPRGGWTQLLPANAELRAELASVTAERDGLKILNRTYGHNVSELAKNCDDLEARAGLAESQLTALRERLERAEGALAELEKLATVRERHKIWSALKAIANAEQKWVSGVGSYAGGETNAGFACRLQNIARTALQGATQ